ncbi:MAG: hypothetical protein IKW78_03890 [Prevotella sp.]|nr:hypothetical protein [Prevotella sp.]
MTKEDFLKKFKASLALKTQMLEESQKTLQSIQHELQTTGRIACLS